MENDASPVNDTSVPVESKPTKLDRRQLLRGLGAGTGLAALGAGGIGTAAAEETTVSGGGDALQTAIDDASADDTIVVTDSETYDTVSIDVSVTIETDADPIIEGDGGTGAAVSIDAEDVTVAGFTVANPDGLLGLKIENEIDSVSIKNNTVENIGPTGRLGVTGIIIGQGAHDDIEITNNVIQNLDQETTEDSGFPTVNGILFDADNSDPGTITNSVVNNNTIQDVESDIAPLGIVVQHKTDGVDINNNDIRDLVADPATDSEPDDGSKFEFTFAQGINIASPETTDTVVNHNVIENITSEQTILPEAVKIDGDGSGVTFRSNQLLAAVGLNNKNGTDDGSRDPSDDPVIDAKNNWWGSSDGPEEAAYNQAADDDDQRGVIGNVTYEPYLKNPPGKPNSENKNQGNGNGNSGKGQN